MLANRSVFICKVEVDATYGNILYNANKGGEWLQFRFRVIKKLHQDMILGFDW